MVVLLQQYIHPSVVNNKLLKNLFSSGVQAIATQILGSIFFYVVSLYVVKADFGVYTWANAVSVFLTMLISFGLEQVVIRRIASSDRSDWAAIAYLCHAFIGSVITLLILILIGKYIWISKESSYLIWLFIAQAVLYIGAPFRVFLNAKELFTPYGVIAFISNLAKILLAFVFLRNKMLSVNAVILISVICALFELVALAIYVNTRFSWHLKFKLAAYIKLVKESFAQYLSVIFDSSLSRMDWILVGILTTKEITADYTFAYRAFEVAKLPLLIIAPVVLPRFARLLSSSNLHNEAQKKVNDFFSIEIFVAIGIPMVLTILWSPVISLITHDKYGSSNQVMFWILSACLPLQFIINLLWTISFAGKRYKWVRNITIITAIVNVVLNLVLIPLLGGVGAAIAYFTSNILQVICYYYNVQKEFFALDLKPFIVMLLCAGVCLFLGFILTKLLLIRILIAIVIYIMLAFILRIVNKEKLIDLKAYLIK